MGCGLDLDALRVWANDMPTKLTTVLDTKTDSYSGRGMQPNVTGHYRRW